jgi:hypothetical protein
MLHSSSPIPDPVHHTEPLHAGEAMTATARSSILKMPVMVLVLLTSLYWIGKDLLPGSHSESVTVKLKFGLVTFNGRFELHIISGTTYSFDHRGETAIPHACRGAMWELWRFDKESNRYILVQDGIVPATGPLLIWL